MRNTILPALLMAALAAPALAGSYPVFGSWGESASSDKGAINCSGKRIITFNGDQRTDSQGGVPNFRNESITTAGPTRYRVVDEFTTVQISNARTRYTLRQIDVDHIEIDMQPGGVLKLRRCK
jgi:hypothetical protein